MDKSGLIYFIYMSRGSVDKDTRTGRGALLTADEEQKLVTYISYIWQILDMAKTSQAFNIWPVTMLIHWEK